jgi:4-hydroxy-2-oxoheptanedioate aldolase
MSRMFDRIAKGEVPVGTVTLANGPEYVEILGYTGMDFICIDMMLTSIDWKDAADLIRAANRYDVTPWIRLQGFPWGSESDPRSTADVLRALSIGAECVTKSVDTPEEAEALLLPASDWHRRVYIYTGDARADEEVELRARLARETLIFPLIESLGAARRIDEILAIKGLRAVFLGMGDLSRVMGHPGEPHHPEMRAFVKTTVERARQHGVIVIANTGRQDTPQSIADAVAELWDIGVRVIWIPYPTYILSRFYADTNKLLKRNPSLVGASA